MAKHKHTKTYLDLNTLSIAAKHNFSDMRELLNDYASSSSSGGAGDLPARLSIMCDRPHVKKMKRDAHNAQRRNTKTTKSLSNQISHQDSTPLHEICSKTLALCGKVWADTKIQVMSAVREQKNHRKKTKLTLEQRKQLAGLFLTVHYLSVCVERSCNILSLRVVDGMAWLEQDILVSTQNKTACLQAFSAFASTPTTKAYLKDYVHYIRGVLCKHDCVAEPRVDDRDLQQVHTFLSLAPSSWSAYLAARGITSRGQ
jgi:hypothetical protein